MVTKPSLARRVLLAFAAAALAVSVCACGNSGPKEEDNIRSMIDATMAIFKNPTSENISEYIDDATAASLEAYNIDLSDFLTHAFKNLSYTIDEVTVDGDTAQAKMTVTNVNLDEAMDAALAEFDKWTDTDEAVQVYGDKGQDGLYQKLFDLLYEQIDKLGDGNTKTTEATLYLAKQEDGSWDITNDADNQEFYSALYGGASF